MLPVSHRLTRSTDFRQCVRHGVRGASERIVVHLLTPSLAAVRCPSHVTASAQTRVGLVVGKTVGNAVVRNRVSRRLRHLMADRLETVPRGSVLVLRAQVAAGPATWPELTADVDAALARAVSRAHLDTRR